MGYLNGSAGNNCSAAAGSWNCSAQHVTYKMDLDVRIAAIMSALTAFEAAVASADASAAPLRTNMTKLRAATSAANTRLASAILAAGSCAPLSLKYHAVYAHLCGASGLSHSLSTVWACVLLLALLHLLLLPSAMHGLKLGYQLREGAWRPSRPGHIAADQVAYLCMHLDEAYAKVTATARVRAAFERDIVAALADCLQCPLTWVQVEGIRRGSVVVEVSLWAPADNANKVTCTQLVEEMLRQVQDSQSRLYQHEATQTCYRLESLDAHGREVAGKMDASKAAHHAGAAAPGDTSLEAPGEIALGAVTTSTVAREAGAAAVVKDGKHAMARYAAWSSQSSGKTKDSLAGILSASRADSARHIPSPPLHPEAKVELVVLDADPKDQLAEALEIVRQDDPFAALRLTDPEDSIFGNPMLALQEIQLEIEGMVKGE